MFWSFVVKNYSLAFVFVLAGWCLPQAGLSQESDRWPTTRAETTEFVPDDPIVSNAVVSLLDPEFDQEGHWAAWQLGPTLLFEGILLVAKIDPATGEMLDPLTGLPLTAGGRGQAVDSGLVEFEFTGNGPEWASGLGGSQIVYTKYNENQEISIAKAQFDGTIWVPELLANGNNRFTPKGSKNPDDQIPTIAYFGFVQTPNGVEPRLGIRLLDFPSTERILDVPSGGGNFVPGESLFVTDAEGSDGTQQVFMYDYVSEQLEQISDEPGDKHQVGIWRAPELADEFMIVAEAGLRAARIYRENPDQEGNPTWTPFANIESPNPAKPFIRAPRPFVHAGKSYITFMALISPNDRTDGEIWLADISPNAAARFTRRLSNDSPGEKRFDPEPFMLTDGPVVYYSAVLADNPGINTIRRAATGL